MEAFFTRQRANEGIELPLDLPDGTPTAHRIRIRGIDSDAFRTAHADSKRRMMEILMNQGDKATPDAAALETERLQLLATLVVSWTFKDSAGNPVPCTPQSVLSLLREAPQLAEQIDRIASKRSLFFVKGSPSSTPSLPQSSS